MFADLTWSSGLIADGTGSELARVVGYPDVLSAPHGICHTGIPYSIDSPYTCIGNIIMRGTGSLRHKGHRSERRCYGGMMETVK